jgi:hypothetical protein
VFIGSSALAPPAALQKDRLDRELSKPPCRDYDSDCDDMTARQINDCYASNNPCDDQCGYCVMKRRSN